ncbi:MAG: restriction endonuclease subunit S [Dehalococcoidia bacterium]
MSLRLQSYPKYKSSGIPWLGEIPVHWSVLRLKHVSERIVGGSTPASGEERYWDGDVVWVTPADVSKSLGITGSERRITDAGLASCSSVIVPPGSIVVTSRAPVGGIALAKVSLCTNQGCKAIVPNPLRLSSEFVFHVLGVMKRELQSLSRGTTFQEITTTQLANVEVPIPQLETQQSIVAFLTHADRRINRLIRLKRRLIDLLNEEKQAIIQRAVTHGLVSDVQFKPSGVEWLGDVPEHWEVSRCGQLFREVIETGHPDLELLSIDRFRGVVRQADIGRKERAPDERSAYKLVQCGELAYNLMNAFMGSIGVSPLDGILSPAYAVARPTRAVYPTYFHYLLRTPMYLTQFNRYSYGIMYERNRLYFDRFKTIPTLLPPFEEQSRIVQHISREASQLDLALAKAQHGIDLLREYRTRLIADVVTGKLDVRGVELPLLEDAEVPEDLDLGDEVEPDELAEDEEIEDAGE